MWKRKSYFVISLSLLIAFVVWCQMGAFLVHIFFGVNIKANFFKFCFSLFKEDSVYYFVVVTLLSIIISYSILSTLFKIAEQYFLSRRFKQKLFLSKNVDMTRSVNETFNRIKNDILVVNAEQPLAFTLGFRRPFIVFSTGLIRLLDFDELEAVVEHEAFHQKKYDPLVIFILQLISNALWFVPLTKWCHKNYKIISELSADENAIHKMGTELGISAALLKLIKHGCTDKSSPVLVHFSNESVNYRLQQLIDPHKTIPLRAETTTIFVSIYVLVILIGMTIVIV
ncbi:M56 family metallopeptidase [Peribacillus frigoritolerans]|uniref:M56 family metallopeptidase n=1 Tax=Peribacillus frigoritolerans TaxID=450367 RepID=UPI0010707EA7|nr:M56 family metallopeptidase [Peribacillus frigoritolerans]TFH62814.1 M56 family peptidase [Peribacillus frigoritolerans]